MAGVKPNAAWLLFVVFAAGAVGQGVEAWRRVTGPPFAWVQHRGRWAQNGLGAALHGVFAGACAAYAVRRAREDRDRPPAPRPPEPWGRRRELRLALRALALVLLLSLPIEAVRTLSLIGTPQLFGPPVTFWDVFDSTALIAPGVALAVLVYDRRRLRREQWRIDGLCPTCGYDLRATPQRCPECGSGAGGI